MSSRFESRPEVHSVMHGVRNPDPRPSYAILGLILSIGPLVIYKTTSAIAVLRSTWISRTMSARRGIVALGQISEIGVLQRSINYLLAIWPALVFGILIGSAARAFIPPHWFGRLLKARTAKAQLCAGLAGAPLMLCSCCVAPIFTSVAESSERLGPALGLMLASPALNPAALALTFMLFEPRIAANRLLLSVLAVALIGPSIERIFRNHEPRSVAQLGHAEVSRGGMFLKFLKAIGAVAIRTIPGLVAGVVTSMFIVHWLPAHVFERPEARATAILVTATVAVPLALPTFLEIPLSLGLLAGGFPEGAAVALLFAGPAVNLPSLFSVGRVSGWKVAAAVAIMVWVFAACGGLLAG